MAAYSDEKLAAIIGSLAGDHCAPFLAEQARRKVARSAAIPSNAKLRTACNRKDALDKKLAKLASQLAGAVAASEAAEARAAALLAAAKVDGDQLIAKAADDAGAIRASLESAQLQLEENRLERARLAVDVAGGQDAHSVAFSPGSRPFDAASVLVQYVTNPGVRQALLAAGMPPEQEALALAAAEVMCEAAGAANSAPLQETAAAQPAAAEVAREAAQPWQRPGGIRASSTAGDEDLTSEDDGSSRSRSRERRERERHDNEREMVRDVVGGRQRTMQDALARGAAA
jgi:hypothetical protein